MTRGFAAHDVRRHRHRCWSSGATLAGRLSETAKRTVLLLEGGPDFRSAQTPPEVRSANSVRSSWTRGFSTFAGRDLFRGERGCNNPRPIGVAAAAEKN